MNRLKLILVCLFALVPPITLLSNLVLAQNRARQGGQIPVTQKATPPQQHGKPFVDYRAPMPKSVTQTVVPKTRAARPQTVDLTPNTPNVNDTNPFWARDEQTIVFQSDRSDLQGTTAGPLTHIFRMGSAGGQIVALTGPLSTGSNGQPIGATSSQTEPALNLGSSAVVYINRDTSGAVTLRELNLTTKVDRQIALNRIVNAPYQSPTVSFTDLNHPEYGVAPGGNVGIIFAGIKSGDSTFHIFTVDTSSGDVVQLTGGAADDRNPTLSPDAAKPVIAFDSNRADAAGSTKGNRDIWVIGTNPNFNNARQVTNFTPGGTPSNNIQPSWSTNKADVPTGPPIINRQQLLAFASTRYDTAGDGNANGINPNGTHDIYWLKVTIAADPQFPAAFTVTTPETGTNVGRKLVTSDPQHIYDDLRPSWPQFIATYRVAYQSDRTFHDAGSNTSGPAGRPNDIFASDLIDINVPALVRFDDVSGDALSIQPRLAFPGSPVTIKVKLQDLESGVNSVYLQVKNPNSKYQSSDGLEHKVFQFGSANVDGTNCVINVPQEFESEPVFIGTDPSDSRFNTYPRTNPNRAQAPTYTASVQDRNAFSGSNITPDAKWLPMTLESRDPQTGIETYTATWTTPNLPSDYYVDVVVFDNATNPFFGTPGTNFGQGINWRIYDNVWGFTTKSFNPSNGILFVSDYAAGQKFFSSRFDLTTLANVAFTFWGTESWLTDFDVSLFPTSYLPCTGGTMPGVFIDVRNTLGVRSYTDSVTTTEQTPDGPLPTSMRYDIWRVLCRGPVTPDVLAQYLPHTEQQPPDTFSGETNPRTVNVAPRCVVWHAPYAGDVFTGAGTITDLATQTLLHSYLQAGGRLFVNGQDIAWALTLNGAQQNSFVSNDLRASFVSDTTSPVGRRFVAAGFPNPITHDPWRHRTINFPAHRYPGPETPPYNPISQDPNFFVFGTIRQGEGRGYGSFGVGQGFPDLVQPNGQGVSADTTSDDGPTFVTHYADAGTGQRVVYCSAGLEGLNVDAFSCGDSCLQDKNRQMEFMHNTVCWLRTGTVFGTVRELQQAGEAPLERVLVRLYRDVTANGTPIYEYTALTDAQGRFTINGVEPDIYTVVAVQSGFTIARASGTVVHGGDIAQVPGIRLTRAEPVTIRGKVTTQDGVTPVVGATVTATDISNPAAVFTATTDANGNYAVERVPAFTKYRLTAADPRFGASTPTEYIVSDPNDPTGNGLLQPAKVYEPYNFQLRAIPGSLTGTVVVSNPTNDPNFPANGTPISGATVTATCGTQTATAVTDGSGNFSFSPSNNPANGLDPGTCTLVAVAPGYAANSPVSVVIVSNQTATTTISLTPVAPGQLSGLVTRTSDGSPLAGTLITLKDPAGNTVATTTTGAVQTENGYTFNYRFTSVPAGVTYTVTATQSGFTSIPASQSAAVTTGVETKNVNFQMEPLHTFPGALSLVSAPYEYAQVGTGRVVDLLSVTDQAAFLFATWDVGAYIFYPTPPADTFHLGRGYFMAYKNNLPLSIQGTPADATRPFDIPLNAGWNLIGDPFPFDIDWTKVTVVDGGVVKSHDQAIAEGAIGPALYSFASGSYLLDFTISPWKGYWARAYRNVILRIDPVNHRLGRAAAVGGKTRAVLQGGQGWSFNLRVKAGTAHDDDNYLGVASRAADGFDGFKAEKPPIFGTGYVYMTFDHSDWGERSGGYGMDVRSASVAKKTWEFSVRTDVANSTATITWPNIGSVGRATTLTLTDVTSGTVRDMRTSGSYSWPTGETPGVRKFRVDAARSTIDSGLRITDVVTRSGGRGTAGVNISYNLSTAANVEVRILGASGSQIRRVNGRASRAAGVNQVTWDQKNDQNVAVPSGTYTVEIRAQSTDGRLNVRQVAPVIVVR